MSKAFTKESDGDGAPDEVAPAALVLPAGTRNYVTPAGMAAYQAELAALDAPADAAARARASWRASRTVATSSGRAATSAGKPATNTVTCSWRTGRTPSGATAAATASARAGSAGR